MKKSREFWHHTNDLDSERRREILAKTVSMVYSDPGHKRFLRDKLRADQKKRNGAYNKMNVFGFGYKPKRKKKIKTQAKNKKYVCRRFRGSR